MKQISYIILLIYSLLLVSVVVTCFNCNDFYGYSIDLAGEGGSEKDISENVEDDNKIDPFSSEVNSRIPNEYFDINDHKKWSIAGHFMEIPDPPPERV